MVKKALTASIFGIEGIPVVCEVDEERALPGLSIVGLGDAACNEAGDRVRSAIKNSDLKYPKGRITVNLSPGWIRKKGSHFDLAIAASIMTITGDIPDESLIDKAFIGELSLSGDLREVNGVLPMISGLKDKVKEIYLPVNNACEAYLAVKGSDIKIVAISNLAQLKEILIGERKKEYFKMDVSGINKDVLSTMDYMDVKGHLIAKDALVTAISGGHGILLVGPPGVGKSMLARRIPTILPDMTSEEKLETSRIYSLIGELNEDRPIINERPFRQVNRRSTIVTLLGGGNEPYPGEISLANNGILFMDEFLEFDRAVIDSLRKPIEDGKIIIMRRGQCYQFPSKFTLVAATNPCPCGYLGDDSHPCTCSKTQIDKYKSKLSGPIAERIDMAIEVKRVGHEHLIGQESYSSVEMKKRVMSARKIQEERFKDFGIKLNSEMNESLTMKFCTLGKDERMLMERAYSKYNLSPRRYHKILKLARTVADLRGGGDINIADLASAMGYTRFFGGDD